MTRGNFATVHILKKEAGLDDKAYRDLLFKTAGVRSSKDLNDEQFLAVISALENVGAKSRQVFKEKRKPIKKEDLFAYSISKPHEPWKYIIPTEDQIKNFGKLVEEYAKQHITIVGMLDDNGWKWKWRHMLKGRDY